MFENLTGRLQEAFRHLSGQAALTESNIAGPLREIRAALLEADINHELVGEFISDVRSGCLGAEVVKGVSPGQFLVKLVNDRLVDMMGEEAVPLDLSGSPAVIVLAGLHGSGKTTTCAKLAMSLRKQGRSCLLVAGDIYRPAAIDQLEILAREVDVPVHSDRESRNLANIASAAVEAARLRSIQVVIIDTAGRLQIDDSMLRELVELKRAVNPSEILLTADAALGQEAVSVAGRFHEALGITGVILTKMDGDARGGAALSIRKVTGAPIKFIGQGEKLNELDVFYPERIASRILGMGDVVSLVEKATEDFDEEQAAKLTEKLRKNSFDFNDFLQQISQLRKLGGIGSVLKMLPGGAEIAKTQGFDGAGEFERMEAMIFSMTPQERENPDIIDMSRRRRIAKGSGVQVEKVSSMIKSFMAMRKMMKNTGMLSRFAGSLLGGAGNALFGGGTSMVPSPGGMGMIPSMPSFRSGSNFTPSKKKRRKKR